VITGGDYTKPTTMMDNTFYTNNGGKTWKKAASMPNGYRSSICITAKKMIVTCGTSGVDVSVKNRYKFYQIDDSNYNVAASDDRGKDVFLAGNNGFIAILQKKI
jgi:hypothetical protein